MICYRDFCDAGNAHAGLPCSMIPVTLNTFLEYSGAGLGILGWLGVRQIGSFSAQLLGFIV